MLIEVDTHTHTMLSGHAFSTLEENMRAAAAMGLKHLCITDHGPMLPGAAPYYVSGMYSTLPAAVDGVRMHYGLELNIIDFEGGLDLPPERMRALQFALAGMHELLLPPKDKQAHTGAYEKALANVHIDALSHPGSVNFECDIQGVVAAAKKHGKLIEINNHSFYVRPSNIPNCIAFAKECMLRDVRVIVSSDAHFSGNIGVVDKAMAMLGSIGFPRELIVNLTAESFEAYMRERARRVKTIFG